MTDEAATRDTPDDVHELLERIDAAWRALHTALDGIPEDRLEAPGACGEWSIGNLMGHIAFWDERALPKIDRAFAGLPPEEEDVQALNDADHAARQARNLAEERSAMHQAHAAVVARLEEVVGIKAGPIDAAIRPDTYEHYAEHVADITAWRQRAAV